jgi:Negative regulator of beta-lactamase expression
LIKKYRITLSNILGHSDVAFDRKKDPGEKFPWEYLSKKKIGFWHNIEENELKRLRNKEIINSDKIRFFKFLFKIGYFNRILKKEKKNELIKSFQRRFRQKLINGKIDQECLLIAKTLSKIS